MKIPKSCKLFDTNIVKRKTGKLRELVLEENKRKMIFRNQPEHFLVTYNVDGGLISLNFEKGCDYLVLDCDCKKAYFIELKGSDLGKASEQILNTVRLLRSGLGSYQMNARIVLSKSRSDNLRSTSYSRLVKFFKPENIVKGNSPLNDILK